MIDGNLTPDGKPSRVPPNPPLIESFDELIDRKQLSEILGVAESTIDNWRYGHRNATTAVTLPFYRLGNQVWFWKGGIIWWLNKHAERPDLYHIDRMRRLQEGTKVARRKND